MDNIKFASWYIHSSERYVQSMRPILSCHHHKRKDAFSSQTSPYLLITATWSQHLTNPHNPSNHLKNYGETILSKKEPFSKLN